jgi:thiosulfate/3-mercaptopyruvate sulfurtransferase
MSLNRALISTDALAARLADPNLVLVDASWYLPDSARDPRTEYEAERLPGAVFFDLDASSAQDTALPHMLPSPGHFAARMEALGIGEDSDVVVYDGSGVNLSAPRLWWALRAHGHRSVAVLDGGSVKWRRESRPLESGPPRAPRADCNFTPRYDPARVRDLAAMRRNLSSHVEQVVDMRRAGRFAGTVPEPRPGVRPGHIPGSLNLPYDLLVGADGTLLPPDALRRRIVAAGVDLDRPIIASCGSGTSACAFLLALDVLGVRHATLYDGSWTEWGSHPDTPVETG